MDFLNNIFFSSKPKYYWVERRNFFHQNIFISMLESISLFWRLDYQTFSSASQIRLKEIGWYFNLVYSAQTTRSVLKWQNHQIFASKRIPLNASIRISPSETIFILQIPVHCNENELTQRNPSEFKLLHFYWHHPTCTY